MTQIKAEELRIGNLVRHKSVWSYRQPDTGPFTEFEFKWEESDWFAIGESLMLVAYLEPVPITEELLLKAGFVKHINNDSFFYSKTWGNNGVEIVTYSEVYQSFCYQLCQSKEKVMQYFHQLQNLYFALTGKELTL